MDNSPFKLAYIVSRFPKLTETFVVNELLAMQTMGIDCEVFSLMRGNNDNLHPGVQPLVESTHFEDFISIDVLKAQLQFLRRDLKRYCLLLIEILFYSLASPRFFGPVLALFLKTVSYARAVEASGVSHIHAQFANHPATAAFIIARLTDVPFSFTARGSDIQLDRTMLAQKVRAAACVLCVSEDNRQLIIKTCGPESANKTHVVYGGVDVNRLSPTERKTLKQTFTILCVARFEEVKGHTFLVQACSLLRKRGVNFECRLIGGGPLQAAIAKQVKDSRLEPAVTFLGPCNHERVIEELARADVAVLATAPTARGKCEGIPNVLKEAMSCGVPVVSSRVPGVQELVESGVSGILVRPRDSTELAEALEFLFRHAEVAAQMGVAGRNRIIRDFNLQQCVAARYRLFLAHSASTGNKKDGPRGPSSEELQAIA